MFNRFIPAGFVIAVGFLFGQPANCVAEAPIQVWSSSPPNVEYQYQMYYPRWYGYGFFGPGLSLGGSLPTRGREGYSSFYGRPIPAPLGAGVYVNPFAYATQLPGGFAFGLAGTTPPKANPAQPTDSMMQAGGGMIPPSPASLGTSAAPVAPSNPTPSSTGVSNASTLQKSREIELIGDEKLGRQQWLQAYVNYSNAVTVANDRADAHMRLGFACLPLKRYSEAAREFKQALTLDPAAGRSGETLATIYGPDSQSTRSDIMRNVAVWARDDLKDPDRLFLLGVVLHYNEDQRAKEILQAAFHVTGSGEHVAALLTTPMQQKAVVPPAYTPAPTPDPPTFANLPELHRQPLALKLDQR